MKLAVAAGGDEPGVVARAAELAGRLCLPLVQEPAGAAYVLLCTPAGLSLCQTGKGAPGPLNASFLDDECTWRLHHGGGKGQLIARAIGRHRGARPTVLDATAGLGRDAFVMAGLGCEVTLLERSPLIGALLEDSLQRLRCCADEELAAIGARMRFVQADALEYLPAAEPFDLVYLDPMFPAAGKSAGVKKAMALFRELLEEPGDENVLLDAALARARHRVVVKRMKKTPVIPGPAPSYQLAGKSTRYDIYALQKYY